LIRYLVGTGECVCVSGRYSWIPARLDPPPAEGSHSTTLCSEWLRRAERRAVPSTFGQSFRGVELASYRSPDRQARWRPDADRVQEIGIRRPRRPPDPVAHFSSFAKTVCLIVGSTCSRFFCDTTIIGTRICFSGFLPSR